MLTMLDLIEKYLKYHENAWSKTTMRSTKSRLVGIASQIKAGPEALWRELGRRGMKPYSKLTTWTQVMGFINWCITENLLSGPNEFKRFRDRNRMYFKGAYEKKKVGVSFEEARARIVGIRGDAIRRRALEILGSGTRWAESQQAAELVRGKGGKVRRVYRPDIAGPEYQGSYSTFYRALKKETGLTPHNLRALCATKLAAGGMREADLMEVFGWSSITTASKYLQPSKEEKLEQDIRQMVRVA